MKRFLFFFTLCFNLSYASGTYDGYAFTDEEEKYSLHFVNTAINTEMTGIGLAAADSTAILGLRPITSLSTVASNTNITGRDMVLIRSASYAVEIPPHSYIYDVNDSIGMTIHEQNFLYGLTGLIVGAGFYIGFITLIVRMK